jgi:transposase-like protein
MEGDMGKKELVANRQYTDEFKVQAVKLGESIGGNQAAKRLGIPESSLWLQRLHACGLLHASFRPGRDIAALRAYLRVRERHLDYAAAHIQHMQKALP